MKCVTAMGIISLISQLHQFGVNITQRVQAIKASMIVIGKQL